MGKTGEIPDIINTTRVVGFLSIIINMAFRRFRGKTKTMQFPVTVSTEFTAGSIVYMNTSAGTITYAGPTTAGNVMLGVITKTIASTDDDYAVARTVAVEVPVEKYVEWEADVTASLATTDLGKYLDLTNAYTVNPSASTYDIAFCTQYISTTKGLFILNIGPESLGVAGD